MAEGLFLGLLLSIRWYHRINVAEYFPNALTLSYFPINNHRPVQNAIIPTDSCSPFLSLPIGSIESLNFHGIFAHRAKIATNKLLFAKYRR